MPRPVGASAWPTSTSVAASATRWECFTTPTVPARRSCSPQGSRIGACASASRCSIGDLVSVARPWTKWAYEVERVEDVPTAVRRAIQTALTPPDRAGLPVAARRCADGAGHVPRSLSAACLRTSASGPRSRHCDRAAERLAGAKNPAILAGSRVTAVGRPSPNSSRLPNGLARPSSPRAPRRTVGCPCRPIIRSMRASCRCGRRTSTPNGLRRSTCCSRSGPTSSASTSTTSPRKPAALDDHAALAPRQRPLADRQERPCRDRSSSATPKPGLAELVDLLPRQPPTVAGAHPQADRDTIQREERGAPRRTIARRASASGP